MKRCRPFLTAQLGILALATHQLWGVVGCLGSCYVDIGASFGPKVAERGDDLVQGTRHEAGGGYQVTGLRIWFKKLASVMGNLVVRHLAGLPATDCSANFRVIRKDAWERIETREANNAILFEMIFKCHPGGLRVSSIPVTFQDRRHGQSKLSLVREIPRFLLRMFDHVGRYRLKGYELKAVRSGEGRSSASGASLRCS